MFDFLQRAQQPPTIAWRAGAIHAAVLTVIWWVLADGEPSSWLIGAPVVLIGAMAGQLLSNEVPKHWSAAGILRFVPYFLMGSLRGGITTAAIVLAGAREVEPVFIEYKTTLPSGAPTALFVGIIGLLPGTLTADLNKDVLQIHVLDASIAKLSDLEELERKIGAMLIIQDQAT